MQHHKIETEYKILKDEIQSIEVQILKLPEGKLICSKNGKGYKWYHNIQNTYNYIPKSKHQLAEQLALKKYLILKLDDLRRKKRAIEHYIKPFIKDKKTSISIDKSLLKSNSLENPSPHKRNTPLTYNTADYFLINNPEFKKLLKNYFAPLSSELQLWQNEKFIQNQKHPEKLIHKTISGNLVRSKSEAMIDMLLYKNHIPFRYECELQLGTNIFYPDFTIRHPKTGVFYYWEHFGLMDDQSYYKNVYSKLYTYNTFGIISNINLITTFETQEHPLCSKELENIIDYHFL